MLNHVDLFSGIGGFSLGLEATGGFKTTAFCEIDPFCQRVLRKHWPDVPIHDDVRNFEHDGTIHILTGGYPCQPESTAGKRKGKADPRYLWPAMFSIIEHHRPRWIIGENVAGHISMGLDSVLADLENAAYEAIPLVIPACALGAPHRRDRVWIIASDTDSIGGYRSAAEHGQNGGEILAGNDSLSNAIGQQRHSGRGRIRWAKGADTNWSRAGTNVADTAGIRQPRPWTYEQRCGDSQEGEGQATDAFTSGIGRFWEIEPAVGRVVNGLSKGLDAPRRLKSLGNSIVPWIPYIIGNYILEIEKAY